MFDYYTIDFPSLKQSDHKTLDILGSEGWELVVCIPYKARRYNYYGDRNWIDSEDLNQLIFKRRREGAGI